jgi:hypothetical protein
MAVTVTITFGLLHVATRVNADNSHPEQAPLHACDFGTEVN